MDSKHGRVGPGADSSRVRECGRTCVEYRMVGMGADSRRGRMGPGVDSSRVRGCGRKRVRRKCGLMNAGG
jgi:hypothetical protein